MESDTKLRLDGQLATLITINDTLEGNKRSIQENRHLITAGTTITSRILDRVEWITNLGHELKQFMDRIIQSNLSVYREIVLLRTSFIRLGRSMDEDPFVLEDAIGRVAPIHLRFINSWRAFDAVIEVRFQGRQGLPKILRGEYVLQEGPTGIEIDRSRRFNETFLPGQRIVMSLVFQKSEEHNAHRSKVSCPRCHAPSPQPGDIDTQW
jgi:hypothetical protein